MSRSTIRAGLYRRTFAAENLKKDERVYLDFEGVDSCFYVWINKAFVGYSQVSHGDVRV